MTDSPDFKGIRGCLGVLRRLGKFERLGKSATKSFFDGRLN